MPSISAIRKPNKHVSVLFNDGAVVLDVEYNPSAFTPQLEEDIRNAEKAGDLSAPVLGMLLALIVGWDLTEDDDKTPVPVSVEVFKQTPLDVLGAIIEAINGDMRPNPQNSQA